MKESYNIFKCLLFKMFKKFEKVVQGWKNWEKWAKMSAPKSAYIHYSGNIHFSDIKIHVFKQNARNMDTSLQNLEFFPINNISFL